ncbi:flocculation protein FLO11-like [Salvia splendens]|uniref:flocculation protein FLO11-like n=1 Tax=Salvia splendens TaxID=180675 RepID=UPI001C26A901|nr:flocculation protein FLO11-like [Salvia splendens]
MFLEQLPNSSSSSSSAACSEDRRTSPRAQVESPSPSSQPPPQTSATAPSPKVDEKAQRCLTRILQSMPSEMDIATVYATVKACLGISLSKDRATTSTSQNPPRPPPSASQTKAPLRTPEPTPVVPLVQYSGDEFEEEGGAQPAAIPTEEALSVPPPHVEGMTAPNAPTPPSGGGSNSPTLLGPTQPIEAEDESVPETEEEPLRRRMRRMEINTLIKEVEAGVASMQRAEEEQVERPRAVRRLLDEPEEPENQGTVGAINQEAG